MTNPAILVTIFVITCVMVALAAALWIGNTALVQQLIETLQDAFKVGAGAIIATVSGGDDR